MTYRNLFPWLVFVIGLLILKFILYLPLLNAVVSVSFALGVSDLFVWLMAPYCHKQLHEFISGKITELGISLDQHRRAEYTYQASIGLVLWVLLFIAILVTRYVV